MAISNELKPEHYRSFLIYLARRSLPDLGPAAHKVSSSDIVQDVLLQAQRMSGFPLKLAALRRL